MVYDSKVVGDYSFSGTTFIGYDDKQSVVTKVRYAKQRGFLVTSLGTLELTTILVYLVQHRKHGMLKRQPSEDK
ncbi:Class V chitinase [Cardamine amara subsp. amara]|uniref:Class V chitinase n=1 Tax=Cardamine amara subsp. amara TaxID=228776 RepID=A0ABD1BVK3_CARAN